MRSETQCKNYYNILEISESATMDDIKKSYRRLAIKYHPDKNLNNPLSVEKFKEVSEAYEILSDPQKKNQYDNISKYHMGFKTQFSNHPDFTFVSEIFNQNLNGEHLNTQQMFFDISELMNFPTDVPGFANHIYKHSFKTEPKEQKTNDITVRITATLDEIFNKTIKEITIQRKNYTNSKTYILETVILKIDLSKDNLIFYNKSHTFPGHISGDIKVFVNSKPHLLFKLGENKYDLFMNIKLNLEDFKKGISHTFKQLNGENITIEIPPQKSIKRDNLQIILEKGGLPNGTKQGNLYIDFDIINLG